MELDNFVTVHEQTRLFLLSCLLGAPIGAVFDGFRVLRILVPHNRLLVALEDIVFFLLYGVFLLAFAMTLAQGELRVYYPIGNALGFTVYALTVSPVLLGLIRRLRGAILGAVRLIFSPIAKMFALICEKIRAVFVGTLQNIRKHEKKRERHLSLGGHLMYNEDKTKKRPQKKRRARPKQEKGMERQIETTKRKKERRHRCLK